MKKFRRIAAGVLCILMTASLMSGCGGNNDAKSAVKTVTIWSSESHSKAVMTEWYNHFNDTIGKEKGIRIDYQVKDNGTFTQIVQTALQNGEAPDFFAGGGNVADLAAGGYITAIDDIKGGKELVEELDVVSSLLHEGKLYRAPIGLQLQGLVYNKDMFKAAGIVDENGEPTPPKTFDEMREYAKRLTNTAEKKYGIVLPLKWSGWFSSDILIQMMTSVGHVGFNPDTGRYDYSALVPIMKTYLGMKEDGSVFPGAEGLDNDPARAQFSSGNIGMKVSFQFDVGVFNDQFPATCDWGVAPLPVVDENNRYMQRGSADCSPFINKKSVETLGDETIMEVLKFLISDETMEYKYKNGIALPYNSEVVDSITLTDAKTGWEEFAQLTKITRILPYNPDLKLDMGANRQITDIFMQDVWTGKTTPEVACAEYTELLNKLLDEYLQRTPSDSIDNYIDKSYLPKAKMD